MHRLPSLLVLSLMAGFVVTSPRPAAACSCVVSISPCQAFAWSPIVFVGDVLSTEETGRNVHMRLRIVRALKGIKGEIADIWSDATTSCAVRLEEGARYVVYTSMSDGRMSIQACGYSRKIGPGEPEPELPPTPGSIYGRVARYDFDRIRAWKSLEPIASVRLALDLPSGRLTAASDQWGRFQFTNIPLGEHKLSADAGQGLTVWTALPIALSDRDACAETLIVLQPSGKISGQVQTADGQPAAGVYLRLLPDDPAGSQLVPLAQHVKTAGPDGRFTFDGLGPDNYVLAINPDASAPTGGQPYAAAFFGGVDRASATRIALGEGIAIEMERPFVLPPPFPTRTFTVAVTCKDGSTPAATMTQAAAIGARFAESGKGGDGPVHTLTLVRDRAYTLLVSIFIPAGPERPWHGVRRHEDLPSMELAAGAPGRHIALVAPFTHCAETAR